MASLENLTFKNKLFMGPDKKLQILTMWNYLDLFWPTQIYFQNKNRQNRLVQKCVKWSSEIVVGSGEQFTYTFGKFDAFDFKKFGNELV